MKSLILTLLTVLAFGLSVSLPAGTGLDAKGSPVVPLGCIWYGSCCVPLNPDVPCMVGPNGFCIRVKPARKAGKVPPGYVSVSIPDPECDGTGYTQITCPVCTGCQIIFQDVRYWDRIYNCFRYVRNQSVCPYCRGTGFRPHDRCRGFGTIWKVEKR